MHFSSTLTIALVVATTSCGGGGSGVTAPTNGGQMPTPPPIGMLANVTVQDFSFSPASMTVTAGTTVRWTNHGPSAHTTTSDTGVWGSGALGAPSSGGGGYGGSGGSAGGTFNFTFTQPGTYPYHCSLHPPSSYPNFVGTITVTP